MPSALRTLEQERAKHAWDCVQEVKDKHKHIAGDYRAIAVKVPPLIVLMAIAPSSRKCPP